MSKIRDALTKVVALVRRMTTQQKMGSIAIAGLLVAIFALPQFQALFKSDREVVQSLGYQWNSESLAQAIHAEDSKAVEAFVSGEIRIPDRIVWLVMDGKSTPGLEFQDSRPFGEDIVRTLSESTNIETSACESLLSRTRFSDAAWVGWVSEKPAYKRFFGSVCDTSAPAYARKRQAYRETYDRHAAQMSDLVALGHCRPSQQFVFSCVHFYAQLPRSLSDARSKLKMIYRLDCAVASDRTACDLIKRDKWELPPPNPATGARAGAVLNQCVGELKQRFSCPAFWEYVSQPPNLLVSDNPEHATLDEPLEIAVALAQGALASGQVVGGNICPVYEAAIQKGCEQASMAAISSPPPGAD